MDPRPLEGQRVVVTRAAGQAEEFSRQLREAGAEVIEYPVIAIGPPESWAPVDEAIAKLASYDWLVFTSANAVGAFFDRAGGGFAGKTCAVGPATRKALEKRGVAVTLVPGDFIGEGVVEALRGQGVAGQRILMPRAAVARDVVPDGLRALGAAVDVVDVYRNVLPAAPGPFPQNADWVTFTSASTVKNLLVLAGRAVLNGVKTASIGPQTSAALRLHELPVTVEARPSTTEGLLDAMIHWLPVTDELDLHTFAPRDMMTAVEGFLEQAHEQGLTALRIIHGRGAGVQRENVRRLLERTPFVESFSSAPGNAGTTLVNLKK